MTEIPEVKNTQDDVGLALKNVEAILLESVMLETETMPLNIWRQRVMDAVEYYGQLCVSIGRTPEGTDESHL